MLRVLLIRTHLYSSSQFSISSACVHTMNRPLIQAVPMSSNNPNFLLPVRLNNMGAELLSQGKIQESQVHFIKALHYMKVIGITLRDKHQRNHKSMSYDFHFLSPMPMDVDAESFVFKRPIQMKERKELEKIDDIVADVTCSIVFNMTLGVHAQGIKKSKLLTKAVKGYSVALDLRKRRERASSRLLDLGLLNNIAQVHLEMVAYTRAIPYVIKVASLLLHHENSELDAADLDGFISVALWRAPMCAQVA